MAQRLSYFLLSFFLWVSVASSEVVQLHVPIMSDSPKQHVYFHELLSKAIQAAGHTPKLTISTLPQTRIKLYLNSGDISLFWMVESAERNQHYIPIKVGITNGLIGKRILFIKKGGQARYQAVKTLEDFRQLHLVGGMGENWFDAKVWRANNLQYREHSGAWQAIYKMIPLGRNYDYFSRGLNEILDEAKQYPSLAIENKLALIYDRDFYFYLSKTGPNSGSKYHRLLASAMKKAQESGLIDQLVRKHWANDFDTLNYDERTKIYLNTPK